MPSSRTGPAGSAIDNSLPRRVRRILRAYHRAAVHRVFISRRKRRNLLGDFHRYYHDQEVAGSTIQDTYWLGVKALKLPLDLWVYQELISSLRPDLIVESGTMYGGSALFLASICDLVGHGQVITIDIQTDERRPAHPRIHYLLGSSTDPDTVAEVQAAADAADRVMVILDSDHSKKHVLEEMRQYAPLVTPGSYLVVEDTHVNGNPILPEHGPGPKEAVDEFLAENTGFSVDRHCEKFLLSFNYGGYLRKSE